MRLMKNLYIALCVLATPLGAKAATLYTGDRLDGVAVIDKLDIADQPSGKTTRLWFRVMDQSLGQGWYVPVIVIKGNKPGPKFLITAGIHGDELNGIAVIQRLVSQIDPNQVSGTIIAVPGLNTPGLLHSTREYSPEGKGEGNLNRLMPGDVTQSDPAVIYAGRLWSQIFMGNSDMAIDMHTQSRGTSYPMYAFAETGKARHMADLVQPDIINMDQGVKGTVENTLNHAGIPAITLELGTSEIFNTAMINRALRGVLNVMIDAKMIEGSLDMSGPKPFIGNEVYNVNTPKGGYAHLTVALNDEVKSGQMLAYITNAFGEVVASIKAPKDGHVLSLSTDPRLDPGNMVVRLIDWSEKGTCAQTGCPKPSY